MLSPKIKEKAQKVQRYHYIIILLFVLSAVGFITLCVRTWSDKNNHLRVEIAEGKTSSDVDITSEVVKSWDDYDDSNNPCKGAQYDILVENKMNSTLVDLQILITLPEAAVIDSSWNGRFVMTGNEILFTPRHDLDINEIKPGNVESFGMVLKSDKVLNITDFMLVGHREVKITDYTGFYIWLLYTIFVLVGSVVYIIMEMRMRNLKQQRENDEKIIMETMQVIADFVDAKDEYTKGHSTRVASYARKLARKLKMSEDEVRNIGYIALMHDCGKMGIPDNVLNKPGKLNEEEMEIMRSHTVLGGKVLHSITALKDVQDGALYHHERYDGKGYPKGLSGENIPLCARIIGVADSFDAMNSDRCYRKHLQKDQIISELQENAGKQFDPEIAKLMIKMLKNNEI